jgi:cobalt-precorrin 5A hydrolase
MYDKEIAIVAITRRGVETALKINKALYMSGLTSKVYALKKYKQKGVVVMEKSFGEFVDEHYSNIDAFVSVMATGITIRTVAPFLKSKLTDPAVVGVDVAGKFVISLLSGHLGGANELTRTIADGIGATPVITTASDVTGKMCVEDIAKTLHLTIENPQSLVAVNSTIVNNCDRVVIILVGDVAIPIPALGCYEIKRVKNISLTLNIINNYDAGIIITKPYEILSISKIQKPFTILKTRKIVVGLGARKDSSTKSIVEAVEKALENVQLLLGRVDSFATVDIKKDSEQFIAAVEQLGGTLEFLSVDTLHSLTHSDLSPDSVMVQEKIGVGGVCERAALIVAGKKSRLLLKKTKLNGVTVAIALGE